MEKVELVNRRFSRLVTGAGMVGMLLVFEACPESDPQDSEAIPQVENPWSPGQKRNTQTETSRGFLDLRGLIHAHSIYSHDACYDEPWLDGEPNAPCLADFRSGICASGHAFVFLTDHPSQFTDYEFPEVLLFDETQGDALHYRNENPVANLLACESGRVVWTMAGSESTDLMPVGLEHHVGDTPEERRANYSEPTEENIQKLKEAGAVVLVAHTEERSQENLSNLPLDGFEMYNLHTNFMTGIGEALRLIFQLRDNIIDPPHSDLFLMSILEEDERILQKWGNTLVGGVQSTTIMATDCHQNTVSQEMPDGKSGDSYERAMSWFSNHLLVTPDAEGGFDDLALKEALRAGRLYGVVEVMGYAQGFDFHLKTENETILEMGDTHSLAAGPATLHVQMPQIIDLDPSLPAPELTARLMVAVEGGFEEVVAESNDLVWSITDPGAYRAEIRMKPWHLESYLGDEVDLVFSRDYVWIYSNPIFVTP